MAPFLASQKVRFGDVDAAGIAYFPRIHEYLHDAFEELRVVSRASNIAVHDLAEMLVYLTGHDGPPPRLRDCAPWGAERFT